MPTTHRLAAIAVLVGAVTLSTTSLAAEHPSLLFDAADIPKIRARLDGPLRPIRDALQGSVSFPFGGNFPQTPNLGYEYFNDRRAIPDSMLAFAFGTVALDPDSTTGRQAMTLAKNYLVGICNYSNWVFPETQDGPDPDLNSGHFLFGVSLAYDWLYDQLTEQERQRCRDRVAAEGNKVYQAMLREVWWMPEHLQNHNWINTSSLGMAALAFSGELSFSTQPWLDAVKTNLEKVHYVLDLIEGGGWHEGTGYLHYGLDSLIPFSHALVRAGRGPDYADTKIVRDYPTLRRFMMPTSAAHRREYVLWGDFSGFENDNTLLPLFYAARKYRDGRSMWYAQRFISGATAGRYDFTTWAPGQRGMLLAALFYDETVEATPPPDTGAAWDLDWLSKDLSLWTSRSGWEDGGSMLALKTGVFGGRGNWDRMRVNGWPGGYINFGHDHADDMGIHFFADGEWLTTRAPGYWIGRNNGAPEGNRTRYANSLLVDGRGQLGEGVRDCWMGSCTWFWDRESSISLQGSTAHMSYALAAGSRLYPASLGLTAFGRSVLYVDRDLPVVRDVVRANAPKRFEIVYHAMDGASRDGDWVKLDAKNGRALGVKVVSPASFEVGFESQNLVHLNKFDPDGWMTAAMIRPSANTSETVFLTALVPQRSATWAGGRPNIVALDPAEPGRGLRIDRDGARTDVVFNEAPGQHAEVAGLGVTGMAGVRKESTGRVLRAMLASGTSLSIDGTPWIEVRSEGPASIEVDVGERRVDVSGDEVPVRIFAPDVAVVTWNGKATAFDRDGDFVLLPATGGGDGAGGSGGSGGAGGSGGCSGAGGSGGSVEPGGSAGSGGTEVPGEGGTIPTQPGAGGSGGSGGTCDEGTGGTGGSGAGGSGGSPSSEPEAKKKGLFRCDASGGAAQAAPFALALVALSLRRRHATAPARRR